MAISEEMNARIEEEMAALDSDAYLRPGMSYNAFVSETTALTAQAREDVALLVGAGLDLSLLELAEAYLEKLVVEHGSRINAEGDQSESAALFAERMPKARQDRAMLMTVGRFVEARFDGPEPGRILSMVRKGSGDIDTLNDNVAMVGFVRRFRTIADRVRPGGVVVDDALLESIEQEALSLLKLKGAVVVASDSSSEQVDRQSRLITLCVQANREIRDYADAAFYNDRDRYNRDYASAERRAIRSETDETASPTEATASV